MGMSKEQLPFQDKMEIWRGKERKVKFPQLLLPKEVIFLLYSNYSFQSFISLYLEYKYLKIAFLIF